MKKLISWLENDFAPKMNVVNRNVWVYADTHSHRYQQEVF